MIFCDVDAIVTTISENNICNFASDVLWCYLSWRNLSYVLAGGISFLTSTTYIALSACTLF